MPMPSRLSALALTLLLPTGAVADSIDGTWCAPVGARSMTIAGPFVTTPGGHSVIGSYHRHDGSYVVPESEPGTGATVYLRLMGEDLLQVLEPDAPPLVWQRCPPAELNA